MSAKTNLKIDSSLHERAVRAVKQAGYSSVEEFVEHAMEKELAHYEAADSQNDVVSKLKGLGYLE